MWSAAGYCVISIPVFMRRVRNVGIQTHGRRPHEKADNEVANRTECEHISDLGRTTADTLIP